MLLLAPGIALKGDVFLWALKVPTLFLDSMRLCDKDSHQIEVSKLKSKYSADQMKNEGSLWVRMNQPR